MNPPERRHPTNGAMRLGDLAPADLARRCATGGLLLDMGPIRVRIRADLRGVLDSLERVYADFPVLPPDSFADLTLELRRPANHRRWVRQQVRLFIDGMPLFYPVPPQLAPALIEWGLNWVVTLREHRYLLVHASVVERDGFAAILPAKPGSGKSTLAGLLCMTSWRLLSDEFGLVRLDDGTVAPFPRPFSLKGTSIAAVRAAAGATMHTTETFEHPEDGPMVLVRPPTEAVESRTLRATPRWIVFPTYKADAPLAATPVSRADAFFEMQDDAFNYFVLGEAAFETLANVIESSHLLRLTYSRTDEVLSFFERLAADEGLP